MQALLSYDRAPPIAAPFLFFLTAPVYVALAAILLLWEGGAALAGRWGGTTLALTHLMALGVMLQIMLGALIQVLPVVAGANMRAPLLTAGMVHPLFNAGVLVLVWGFLHGSPLAFDWAMLLLGSALSIFLLAATDALRGIPNTNATLSGLKLSIAALLVTVGLGLTLAGSLAGHWSLPVVMLTNLHAGWGLGVWGLGLLSAVAYVVVPMFQMTPAYPVWFMRLMGGGLFAVAVLWSLSEYLAWPMLSGGLQAVLLWLIACFCALTLWLQQHSRRARRDATMRLWQGAMGSGIAAALLWDLAYLLPAFGEHVAWPVVFGVLVLLGGFVSAITGMLYKITPFLAWLHLQNMGGRLAPAPNMKLLLPDAKMLRQMRWHFLSCILLLMAACWPGVLVYPAALALLFAAVTLQVNLLHVCRAYVRHQRLVREKLRLADHEKLPEATP